VGRRFSWKAEAREGILTVLLKGELDLPATAEMSDELHELARREERLVVIDLRAVTFMDSSGLRLLVTLRNTVTDRGARLLLGDVSPAVRRVVDVAGLTDWFEYVEGTAL
jgi:anti-anti-sigma factor